MIKIRYLILLAGICAATYCRAETKPEAEPDGSAAWPDKSSSERQKKLAQRRGRGSYRHMKSLTVYHTGKDDTFYYSATKVLLEFDCKNNRSKILKTYFFYDSEAKKSPIYTQTTPGEWKPEVDRDKPKSLIQAACDST
mgnify:CR=1 FL=1